MTPLTVESAARSVGRDWRRFLAVLDSSPDADWSRPTRLAGWTVTDLVVHTVWGVSMEADALRRCRLRIEASAEGQVADPSSPPRELATRLRDAVEHLLAELASLDEGEAGVRLVPMPYGTMPLTAVLPILVMEAGVHANDLLAAVGQDEPLPGDVTSATAAVVAAFAPTFAAAASEVPTDGTVVALVSPGSHLRLQFAGDRWQVVGDDRAATATIHAADDSTLMLFALGRLDPADARLTVAGSAEALRLFKRWIPGP